MKVYSCPRDIPAPEVDYRNYDSDRVEQDETEHLEKLKAWLTAQGLTGPNSGRIFRTPRGDGYAEYMMAEGPGRKSFLLHLPYGDKWHDPDVAFLPKKEILKRMDAQEKLAAVLPAMKPIFKVKAASPDQGSEGPGL